MQRFDCVIVGAGFAGLSAAQHLISQGYKVRVLEARDRVGGRTQMAQLAGRTIDAGGMWLGPTQTHLKALAARLGAKTYPTPLEGQSQGQAGGYAFRAPGEAFEDAIGLISKVQLGLLLVKLNGYLKTLDPAAPWAGVQAAHLDGYSVASWSDRHIKNKRVRAILNLIVRSVFCAEPEELSFLFFLFYVKAAGGLEVLIEAKPGGAQSLLFHDSLARMAQQLSDEMPGVVALNQAVRAIEEDEMGVHVTTQDGVYQCDQLIVAIPPGLVQQLTFSPALPLGRQELLKRQIMGACIKVWVAYERPFWRDAGWNGILFYEDSAFAPVFDATPPDSETGFLAGFFDAHCAAQWSEKSQEIRKQEVLKTLQRGFGDQALSPLEYFERDWTRETWSQGCYGAFMPPGALSMYGHSLRQPHGRVHWAGTETAIAWSGYVDGAISSGLRAAKEVEMDLEGASLKPPFDAAPREHSALSLQGEALAHLA